FPPGESVGVWGGETFECGCLPRLFDTCREERHGRLAVHPWADNRSEKDSARRGAILRENWREKFSSFVEKLGATRVYVTIDLDCLRAEEAATNWENGRFAVEDLVWALTLLGEGNRIAAGDICGAWSAPFYARRKQRFASEMDHPKLPPQDPVIVRQKNDATLQRLLPALLHTDMRLRF
ncbi:MAG: hypothetical protein ACR2G0_11045, partial [Chthoniobacterales bacterium]